MDELDRARIRVYLNDPAGRGERLVEADVPRFTDEGPWGFRVEGTTPEPRSYPTDTPEFLHWQLASALERGKRLWGRFYPSGGWVAGDVLPAVPDEGDDLNAYYDRAALHFFRGVNPETGEVVHSGDSPDIVTHEQGHAVLDAIRPDLWDAPHFEVAAFHEAFGDLASIFVALAEPSLASEVVAETGGAPERSNLVSRLAEELGAAVRARFGDDAALPRALRDAVNGFRYADPASLPDTAPASELSAEPHSFCRVMTGACWDLLVALWKADRGEDRAEALSRAAGTAADYAAAASGTAASGADFLSRVARQIVREARDADDASAPDLAAALHRRGLLESPDVPPEGAGADEEPGLAAPGEGGGMTPELERAIQARLPRAEPRGEILTLGAMPPAGGMRPLRGRRRRDLFLHGAEFGPADGAAVEISDAFALYFSEAGLLRASRVRAADTRDAEDARAFVRFLARRGRIAETSDRLPDARVLTADGKSHAVVREGDGVRRLRRVWISRREER